MTRGRTWLAIALGALLPAAPAIAHDFWIEPSSFTPAAGAAVSFHLRVGQGWQGDPFPRSNQRIVRFVLVGPDGTKDIAGAEAVDPAGLARVGQPGLYLAGYASNDSPLELEAGRFEEYLRLEGLEWVIAERARRGESAAGSREVYARCAKSLLRVGEAATGGELGADPEQQLGFDRVLGFDFELVPERNPYALKVGERLPLRLLYGGKPYAGALVVAMPKAHPAAAVAARSDAAGRVRLPLAERGVWLIKAVHMERLVRDASTARLAGAASHARLPGAVSTAQLAAAPSLPRPDVAASIAEPADWRSLWASLTFELP